MRIHQRRRLLAPLFVVAAVLGGAPAAKAQQNINLGIGASHPTVAPWVGLMQSYLQPEVNKRLAAQGNKYKISWKEAYGGTLFKANATLSSVGEGVVDIGWVYSAFEGAKLPLSQVSSYAAAATGDPRIVIDVFNRMVPCTPALKAEWERNNVVFLAATAADTLDLFTSFPVKDLADLKGKKLGASGAIAVVAGGAGVVPVNTALPTMYNDVKTGVISGVITVASVASSIKLDEVTPHITKVDLGSFLSGGIGINKDTWVKLPAEVRSVLQEVALDYSKRLGNTMVAVNAAALKGMAERSKALVVSELPATQRTAWVTALPNLGRDWAKGLDAKGQPGSAVLATYMNSVRAAGGKPARQWDQ